MTPFILLSASVLAADLNGDGRIDGADIAWNLAAWAETAPAKQANILANFGKDWSDRTVVVDVHGATWAAVDDERIDSPLYAGKTRYVVRDEQGRVAMGVDEK